MTEIIIDANVVRDLREKTGAGFMDCKKALKETNGAFEEAVEWLRKKGIASAAKKADRVASEGLVAMHLTDNSAAIIELNSETDFVAKNPQFKDLAEGLVQEFMSANLDLEGFKESTYSKTGKKISETIAEHMAVIGENITLRRAKKLQAKQGTIAGYIHNAVAPGLGKIGVLVSFETDIDATKVRELGKQIAMHIAAVKPESLSVKDLDPALVETERRILKEQAASSGKPENVIEKMIEGRLSKFYEQVVLLEQPFVIDGKTKIADLLNDFGKTNNGHIKINEFVRFELGEGIKKAAGAE